MAGVFYGMGVGTGDPELLTVKAQRVLAGLDVLLAPVSREGRDSLALKTVREYVPQTTELMLRRFPMVRDQSELDAAFDSIAGEVEALVRQGRSVGFVTLGDPMLYSTYVYLLKNLKSRGVETQTIPGITSYSAVSSRLGIPLAEKDEKVAIVPTVYQDRDLPGILERFDTVVLLKASGDCGPVIDQLQAAGLKDSAVFVSRLGLDREIIVHDLDLVRGLDADYLSMIIVRKPKEKQQGVKR